MYFRINGFALYDSLRIEGVKWVCDEASGIEEVLLGDGSEYDSGMNVKVEYKHRFNLFHGDSHWWFS